MIPVINRPRSAGGAQSYLKLYFCVFLICREETFAIFVYSGTLTVRMFS